RYALLARGARGSRTREAHAEARSIRSSRRARHLRSRALQSGGLDDPALRNGPATVTARPSCRPGARSRAAQLSREHETQHREPGEANAVTSRLHGTLARLPRTEQVLTRCNRC